MYINEIDDFIVSYNTYNSFIVIKNLLIICLPQPITSRLQLIPTQVLVLLVCDNSGIMSVWKIGEKNLDTEIRYNFVFY